MMNRPFEPKTRRVISFTILCMVLAGCVQPPVFKDKNAALIKSNYPIVSVNGDKIEKTYQLDLAAGENTLVIVYSSYHYEYLCTFSWLAEAGTAYEVTDQENLYPLTLYRWHRKNRFWALRLDAVNPLQCVEKPI